MKKRLTALVAFCLVCAIALTPLTAFAAKTFDEQDVNWLDLKGVTFYEYYDGLAMLKVDGKFGYIDTKGDTVIPFTYDSAGRFSEGRALVRLGDKLGIIDKSNKFTELTIKGDVSADFYMIKGESTGSYFFGGYAYIPCWDNENESAQRANNLLFDTSGKAFDMGEEGRYAFGPVKDGVVSTGHPTTGMKYIDAATGKTLFDRETAETINADKLKDFGGIFTFYVPDNGLFMFSVEKGDDVFFGFLDKTGKIVIDPVYTDYWAYYANGEFRLFTDGLVSMADETGNYGCLDATGKVVIPFSVPGRGLRFNEGIAPVQRDGKWGMLDKSNKLVIPCEYENIGICQNGYIFARKDGKSGLLDKDGNIVIPFVYSSGVGSVYDDAVIVSDAPGHIGIYSLEEETAPVEDIVPPVSAVLATPTPTKVLVDGEQVAFDTYLINDNNYIKLRDVAFTISGSDKQFEIGWDGDTGTVTITTGDPYTKNGSEMAAKGTEAKTALLSSDKLIIDGETVAITAYKIDGNNYFKLRELGAALDFNVSFVDGVVVIDTTESYSDAN